MKDIIKDSINNHNFHPFISEKAVIVKGNKVIINLVNEYFYRAPYNGYVAIHNSKIPEKWQGNYDADGLQYLNIHGGITYCSVEGDYTVFGFDCAHSGDHNNPKLYELDYVLELTGQMEQQILEYAKRYKEWKKGNKEKRFDILDEIRKTATHKTQLGIGGMLGVLGGGTFD